MPEELFQWDITYKNDSNIAENDGQSCPGSHEAGVSHGSLCVNFEEIKTIKLLDYRNEVVVNCHVPDDARAIIFRRRSKEVNLGGGEQPPITTTHVVGWQKTIEGKNEKTLLFIHPDGTISVSSKDLLDE